jgi:chromosome segregation ATPase
MSQLRIRGVSSLLAVLIVALVFSQLALSQTVQHRQTDLQFVSRMNQQATEMSVRIDELELSLGQTSTAAAAATGAEQRAPERLRHKNRAASDTDTQRLRNELKNLKAQVRQEQDRLRSGDFDDQKNVKEQQARMQKLDARLRQVQTEIAALQ